MRRDTAEEQKGKEPSSSSAYGHMARGQERGLKVKQEKKRSREMTESEEERREKVKSQTEEYKSRELNAGISR